MPKNAKKRPENVKNALKMTKKREKRPQKPKNHQK